MFKSVLIANRGEIACRIARTAGRLGMRTVAVYSRADAGALHVRACDEAVEIGPAAPAESYLSVPRIIEAAVRAGVDCVHPGYGFLAERAELVEACAAAGLVFVGPGAEAIRAMGLKDRAKALMQKAGVPVIPGYHGERQDPAFLKQKAYELGYPVLIKAVAGGGGKGMRRADKHAEFEAALEGASREAINAFGDGRVLIEKAVSAPRHIEFQVFADQHGTTIYLGERDCSVQRRSQKVIEEAPAADMPEALRAQMGAVAVAAARAVGYVGAGTVEFIADGSAGLRADRFWFMEMNTRLQVEHPVTEAVTGIDLVEWQFRVAAGQPLPIAQDDVDVRGHAVEARLYAEDPEREFLPSTGRLVLAEFPQAEGLRVDTGVESGSVVTPDYDPMLAKLIAHGETRLAALDRLRDALKATHIAGPRSNLSLLMAMMDSAEFRSGAVDTGFLERHRKELGAVSRPSDMSAAAAALADLLAGEAQQLVALTAGADTSPWAAQDGFQLTGTRQVRRPLLVDGKPVTATVRYGAAAPLVSVEDAVPAADVVLVRSAERIYALRSGRQTIVEFSAAAQAGSATAEGDGLVVAPMHGRIVSVLVEDGEAVHRGQRLAIIEAMKMEHALAAPADGVVADMRVAAGDQIAEGTALMRIVPPEGTENIVDPVE